MFEIRTDAAVELSTAAGLVFTGRAHSIDFQTRDGLISINPAAEVYLSILARARMALRHGERSVAFELSNAFASWRGETLVILSESAEPIPGPDDGRAVAEAQSGGPVF